MTYSCYVMLSYVMLSVLLKESSLFYSI